MAPPRGRSRKVGQHRIDAAIDALTPMGFSIKQIRRRVNALLKVYDGEWSFIEDSSYQVLIDSIMEEVEEESKRNIEGTEDGDSASDGAEPSSAYDDAKPSHALDGVEPSQASDDAGRSGTHNDAGPSGARDGVGPSSTRTTTSGRDAACVRQAEWGEEWKDISCMDHDRPQDMVTAMNEVGGLAEDHLQAAVGLIPPPRRKPCYGWIGAADEDEDDIIFLESEASRRKEMNRRLASQKNRMHRWDVKQEQL